MTRRKRDDKTKDLFAYAEDNRPSIVYMATNKINGKRYIGITRQTLHLRIHGHFKTARRRLTAKSPFHRAIRLYGEEAFAFTILRECPTYRDAGMEEIRLILELAPEYNASNGGEAISGIGFRPRPESVEKMRKTLKANPTRYWLGKKRPDIAEMQRKRLTGRADLTRHLWSKAHTPEARAKMRATRQAQGMTEAHVAAMARRRKRIVCLDDGRVFFGLQAVADALGCRRDTVNKVLSMNSKQKRLRGLRFQYVEETT